MYLWMEPDTSGPRQFRPKTLRHWFVVSELSEHFSTSDEMTCAKHNSDLSAEWSCLMDQRISSHVPKCLTLFTSSAGSLTKYYNERVCVSVCLSASISAEPHARSLPMFHACCLSRGLVLLRRGDEISGGIGNFGDFVQCIL